MADYQQALQQLMAQRQAAQPSPEDIAANDQQNRLGILLNQLFKAQANVGNIAGKPTDSSGVDFQDYGKAASEQMKQKNLLANQNFDQGLQMQGAGMQVDKFAQDQQAQAAMVARQPMMDARAEQDRVLKERLTNSQIGENEAKVAELKNKAMNGDTAAGKDFNDAMRVEKLRQFINSPGAKDPAQIAAAKSVISAHDAKQVKAAQEKAPTESQSNAASYATRAEEADKQLNKVMQEGFDPTALGRVVTNSGLYPNVLKRAPQQLAEQSQRNFINAILRKESGAVISDSEFDNARKQYFPQPGDSPEVITQKAGNRQSSIANMKAAAGDRALENVAKNKDPSQNSKNINGVEYIKVHGGWKKK